MSEIDILYIVGNGSLFDNAELRYSLRSLEKFGRNIGRVFITGECPAFIDREKVVFTPELDIGCPAINHWWKVDQTFRKTDIGDRALLMYDDIFFCKSVDLNKYPWRWRGLLPVDAPQNGEYRRSLLNAAFWLIRNGHPVVNYEMHQPCIYEKEKFLSMEKDFIDYKTSDVGMVPRSVYANRFSVSAKHMEDLKIRAWVDDLDSLLVGRDCFSIADNCFEGTVQTWLEKNFPTKSRWEK